MRTLTKEQYQLFVDHRKLGKKIGEHKKEQDRLKMGLMKVFGKAESLRTDHGTILKKTLITVEPTTIPAAYSFEKFGET